MTARLYVALVFFLGCRSLSALECERDADKVEDGRTCNSLCSTDVDCAGLNTKCLCDDVCGKSCFNPDGECSAPIAPEDGFVNVDGRSYGDKATYSCSAGYVLVGPSSRTCRSDKKWSGAEPECIVENTCGQRQQIRRRVLSGINAKPGAWPWQVLLFYNSGNQAKQIRRLSSTMGGASIISEKWLLSAAHNFEDFKSLLQDNDRWPQVFLMAVGLTEIPNESQIIKDYIQIYEPDKIYRHPKYDDDTFNYDVALIRVGKRLRISGDLFVHDTGPQNGILRFSDYVQPVCLPCMAKYPHATLNLQENFAESSCSTGSWAVPSDLKSNDDTLVTVTGFGYTSTSFGRSKFLQEGPLKLLPSKTCKESIAKVPDTLFTENMICTGSGSTSENVDACTGDSGGPLVKEYRAMEQRQLWVEVGIVSWGVGCASKYPGFFTHVSRMMGWIMNTTREQKQEAAHPCERSPCMNGGTCVREGEGFKCQCSGQFMGKRCNVGWGQWHPCSKACGGGTRFRVENCGKDINQCPKTYEDCNTQYCEPRDRCPAGYSFRYNTAAFCCKNSGNAECEVRGDTRTAADGKSQIRNWPWMASVASTSRSIICGGALIHKRWVVTAGVCVSVYDEEGMFVLLGTSSIQNPQATTQSITVESVIQHEGYAFPVNDIALLKLQRAAVINDVVKPVCLPNEETLDEDTTCFATGWGFENAQQQRTLQPSELLLVASLRILPFDSCKEAFKNFFQQGQTIMLSQNLCVGKFAGGPDMCKDAIVSPLVCQRRDSCDWFLAGMGSVGASQCGKPGIPSAYTKIKTFQKWIEKHIQQSLTEPEDTGPCVSNPCMNGGICVEESKGFKCRCTGQFTGRHCDVGWGQWQPCSKACEGGTRFKIEKCGEDITKCKKTYQDCNTQDCKRRRRCPSGYSFRHDTAAFCCKNDARAKCGAPVPNPRRVSGHMPPIKNWPWTAALIGRRSPFRCGGALIHKRWVVTGGVCVTALQKEALVVLLGSAKIRPTEATAQRIGIDSWILHENYNYPVNDIALIKLQRAAIINDFVKPVCLPNGEMLDQDTTCFTTGWGFESREKQKMFTASKLMLKATLRILPFDSCLEAMKGNFQPGRNIDQSRNLCVGEFAGGPDMCREAVVSPLVCQRRGSCNWFLAGMGSAGAAECGTQGIPSAYTKIGAYQQWIEKYVPLKRG